MKTAPATATASSADAKKAFPSTTKQRVLLVLTVPLVPLFFCVYAGVRAMRENNPAFQDTTTAPGSPSASFLSFSSPMPQPADLVLALVLAQALVPLRYLMIRLLETVARKALPPSFQTSAFRVDRFATSIFKLVYFSVMVGVGFWLQQDEPWFPVSLGGSGEASQAFVAPTRPYTLALRLYMLVELAYLAHNLVFVLLCKPVDDDTMDFVIHDLTGMLLIGSSYLANYLAIGATITFLNDAADVVHYLLLLATDSRRFHAVVPLLAVFLVSWWYTRLHVFPRECLWGLIRDAPVVDPYVSMLFLHPTNAMLSLLLGLQIYWYQMLARKGLRVARATTKDRKLLAEPAKAS